MYTYICVRARFHIRFLLGFCVCESCHCLSHLSLSLARALPYSFPLGFLCILSLFHALRFTHLTSSRPTQSIMYVPLQVNRSQKSILLIVRYKYLKSCSRDFYSPESDPPHKIMHYWINYSTQLSFGFPPDRICQVEMICTGGVPGSKRHFGGAGP